MDYYPEMPGFSSYLRRPQPGMANRRFDEYYRCYPVVMMPGPDREHANFGGKVFLPPSALDKLTRLHITYPMLFELVNGREEKTTHAGVLEFIAEEGKIYIPQWLMNTLLLEPGDLIQIKSTDLPPGRFVKLQPQSPSFLEISDPRAVLENAFRNFACLTKDDIFTFSYNDQTFDIAVLEIKPDNDRHAVVTMETDLEVDFAAPVGYEPPQRTPATSTPGSNGRGRAPGGPVHYQGTMAQSINYAAIAPNSQAAAKGAKAVSSNFLLGGHRLKGSHKAPTPKASTPVGGASTNPSNSRSNPDVDKAAAALGARRTNGPQPLRLPPGKLFFGYEIKPVRKVEGEDGDGDDSAKSSGNADGKEKTTYFQGTGQKLRPKRDEGSAPTSRPASGFGGGGP